MTWIDAQTIINIDHKDSCPTIEHTLINLGRDKSNGSQLGDQVMVPNPSRLLLAIEISTELEYVILAVPKYRGDESMYMPVSIGA